MIKTLTILLLTSSFLFSSQVVWNGKSEYITKNEFNKIFEKNLNTFMIHKQKLGIPLLTKSKYLKLDWDDAVEYCRNLQIEGQNNWYLPTIEELKNSKQKLHNLTSKIYWSSDIDYSYKRNAFYLDNMYNYSSSSDKNNKYYISCIERKEHKNFTTEKSKILQITNYLIKKEFNIKKPIYPSKPKKPFLKTAKNLVKGRFEKTSAFEKRVEKEKLQREKYITKTENNYKKEVLAYNKNTKRLTDKYNNKILKLKNDIDKITIYAMSKAYSVVYGKPKLKAIDYDADNEIFYGNLTSSKGNFSKKVAIKIPINIAESFFDSEKSTKVVYEYKNNKIYLKDIKVSFEGKSYLAMLTDTDYKSSDIKVAINTRDLNLKTATLLSSTFKANKSDFNIGAINYGKSKVAKLNSKDLEALNKQRLKQLSSSTENLASLLNDSKKVKKNQKAYAVIFGIEDYMLESNVNYSQNSAMMFMQYANKLLGVPDDNIWAFVGNKTSSGFIKSQWNDFLSLVEDDAVVYFYYSGHGVPGNDGNAYILPSDTNAETATNDKTFMLKNIYSNLSKTKAKKVVAFVDSCFSGKDDKGSLLFDGVAPVLKVKKTTFD
ncbi:MAG: caspase family protein, partial [Campylobacterota bacterium]|nr:caspase family protein [Campylobacterota bacterium]